MNKSGMTFGAVTVSWLFCLFCINFTVVSVPYDNSPFVSCASKIEVYFNAEKQLGAVFFSFKNLILGLFA